MWTKTTEKEKTITICTTVQFPSMRQAPLLLTRTANVPGTWGVFFLILEENDAVLASLLKNIHKPVAMGEALSCFNVLLHQLPDL